MSLDVRSLTSRMCIGNLDIPMFIVMRPNPQSFQKTSRKRTSEVLTNTGWNDIFWGNERDIITVSGYTTSKIGNPNQYNKSEYATANTETYLNSFVSNSGTNSHGPKQWANVERSLLELEKIYKLDKERMGSLGDLLKGNVFSSILYNGIQNVRNVFSKNKKSDDISGHRNSLIEQIQNGTAARTQSFIIYNYVIYWGYFLTYEYRESATDHPRQFQYSFTFKIVNSSTDWVSQSLINNFPEARVLQFFTQVSDAVSSVGNLFSSDKLLKNIFI